METTAIATPVAERKKPGPKPKVKSVETGTNENSVSAEVPNVIVKKSAAEELKFFGNVDINQHGRIGSTMPAWYFTQNKERLEQDIEEVDKQLKTGQVMESKKPEIIADLDRMKKKLDDINESRVNLTPYEDAIFKMTESIGKKISDLTPSRSDSMKGVVDAHLEARLMIEPCVKLEGDEVIFARKANCRIDKNGKVSRDDATRMWKMGRRALGENSNSEILRRA